VRIDAVLYFLFLVQVFLVQIVVHTTSYLLALPLPLDDLINKKESRKAITREES